jgi:hypothetical protein
LLCPLRRKRFKRGEDEKRSPQPSIVFQPGVEQNLCPGGAFVEARRFRLVVRNASRAGDEDHGGRRDAGDVGGMVPGAGMI